MLISEAGSGTYFLYLMNLAMMKNSSRVVSSGL